GSGARASRRTSGEAKTPSLPLWVDSGGRATAERAAGAGTTTGAGSDTAGAGVAAAGVFAETAVGVGSALPLSRVAMGVPIETVAPSSTRISLRVPASYAS